MFKMTRWILWGLVSLMLLTILDQVLLHVDLPLPGYVQVHEFYVDFRGRLLNLTGNDPIGRAISSNRHATTPPAPSPATPPPPKAAAQQRYLYVDGNGALQFADSLDEVPLQYRRDAQPMAE